jgi:hypothetical protein
MIAFRMGHGYYWMILTRFTVRIRSKKIKGTERCETMGRVVRKRVS